VLESLLIAASRACRGNGRALQLEQRAGFPGIHKADFHILHLSRVRPGNIEDPELLDKRNSGKSSSQLLEN
jgi:hypothetical protein